jgi:hypothetical protein
VGTDKVTKLLLGSIAAGVWALVLLTGVTTSRLAELSAEVKAIGVDTERIHEDLDPSGDDEPASERTRQGARPDHAARPTAAPSTHPSQSLHNKASGPL